MVDWLSISGLTVRASVPHTSANSAETLSAMLAQKFAAMRQKSMVDSDGLAETLQEEDCSKGSSQGPVYEVLGEELGGS